MNTHIRTLLRESDAGDKWGLAMGARFALCDLMVETGPPYPPSDFTQALAGPDVDDPMYVELSALWEAQQVTSEDLAAAEKTLRRYCALLTVHGRDY